MDIHHVLPSVHPMFFSIHTSLKMGKEAWPPCQHSAFRESGDMLILYHIPFDIACDIMQSCMISNTIVQYSSYLRMYSIIYGMVLQYQYLTYPYISYYIMVIASKCSPQAELLEGKCLGFHSTCSSPRFDSLPFENGETILNLEPFFAI